MEFAASYSVKQTLDFFKVNKEVGLSQTQVAANKAKYGTNGLQHKAVPTNNLINRTNGRTSNAALQINSRAIQRPARSYSFGCSRHFLCFGLFGNRRTG